ncbi:AraC family transcriptional regulator [Mesorhizobium sp. SARCC-RB16n]|uniref:AraC family transcriptional regulator n=1 Tax=Mesorhizobium sp. SARCC-RB16n TaxID=2116687 RepID=UPI00122F7618|nr:AraC family transcriptional regulator [Mesorhizobium sp. SARCC-RB16n]KAA3449570.1 AraC family transcriptional regulator [Mesorhizobium sp. SARCC-RB16n]
MIETPGRLIERPAEGQPEPRQDLLLDVLSQVRLSGSIFLMGEYRAPWALDSPEAADMAKLLAVGSKRLILFHIVQEGHFQISARGVHVEAGAGDLIVLPHGDRHLMGNPALVGAVHAADLVPPPPWQSLPVVRIDGGGEAARVVCGYLTCDQLLFNVFMQRLPAVFAVRPRPGALTEWMQACFTYALDESANARQGSRLLMARLPELLFVEALRLYSEQKASDSGWLAAVSDPVLGRALGLLHSEPSRKWSNEELARRAATSRSVLDERFRNLLGQSPMRYLTEWRMQLAADLLRDTSLKLLSVAERCGYGSEEAFSRAFHRCLGASPAQWREAGLSANSASVSR